MERAGETQVEMAEPRWDSFKIDRRSQIPLHAQIDALLRELIRLPSYAGGALLPDEVSLARQLGVTRSTIRAGMSKLMYEGLVERRQGHGTRVAKLPSQTGIMEWHSLTGEMRSRGIEVTNFALEVSYLPAPDEAQNALMLKPGRHVWCLRRLRGWSDQRVVLTVSWIHPRLGIKGNEDFQKPLYDVLASVSGITPTRSIEDITACAADQELANDLGVQIGSPLLLRKRTTLDASEEPVEYNMNWYRSDIHSLRLDLKRG